MKHFNKFFLPLMITFLFTTYLFAQAPDTLWTRVYGGEHDDCAYSVQETSDGSYIVTGWTRSFGAVKRVVYLLKIDVNGDTIWTKTFGDTLDDVGWSVQETSDNGFIIAGWTESFGAGKSDVYLIKTDANGNVSWTKTYGGTLYDYGYSVQETSDGGFVILGRISSFSVGGFDIFLVKTDSLGNILWSNIYGDIYWDAGYSVRETSDGGYVIAGLTMIGGESWEVYVIKTDSSGNSLWSKTYGGADWDVGYDIQETSDNGFIITGGIKSFGAGSFDAWLIKTDSDGNVLWSNFYGGAKWDEGWSVKETFDGGFIIAGATESYGAGKFDIFLIRTDSNGNTFWTETFGGENWDVGYSIQITSDSGYIIAGKTKSFGAGLYDVYLIKTQPDLGVEEKENERPDESNIRLFCFPNPFAKSVSIRCSGMIDREKFGLAIYDLSGRLVKSFSLTTDHSGLSTAVSWDGNDNFGTKVKQGVYFLKIISDRHNSVKKLIKIR
jgi:TolB-like protein